MKKRLLSLLVCLALAFTLLPTAVGAQATSTAPADENATCVSCSSHPVADYVHMRVLYAMVDAANARIDWLVYVARSTPYNDVDWLLWQLDVTVSSVFQYADRIGATVVCEYVEYIVDGQTVLVDPIRVVDF